MEPVIFLKERFMFRGSVLFVFSWIFFSTVSAQSDFAPGSVLLRSGDTLKGNLSIVRGRISPRIIQFQEAGSSQSRYYSPADLKWFRYAGGDWYFSFTGSIEISSLNDNNLSYDSTMYTIEDTMFVRAALISKASLFYARDRNDRLHLFFSKDGRPIVELAYKKYYIDELVLADYRNQITRRAIMSNKMYVGQLKQAFANCRYVAASITTRNLIYSTNSLMDLFEDYNRCAEARVVFKESRQSGALEISVRGGINVTHLYVSSSYEPWETLNFDNTVGYQAGVGFNWLLPQLDRKWSFNNEIYVRGYSVDGFTGSADTPSVHLQATYFKIFSMAQFQLPEGKVRPILNLGMTNSLELGFDYTTTEVYHEIFEIRTNYEQGFVLGGGARYNHWDGQVRFEFSNGWSDVTAFATQFTTIYFQLGYTF